MRIGYAIKSSKNQLYNQRRRFPFYAKKLNLKYEIANFNQTYDYVIINASSDLTIWLNYNKGKLIFEYLNSSLDEKLSLKVFFRGLAKFIFRKNKILFLNQKKLIRNICKKSYAVVCNSFEQYLTLKKLNKNIYIILDSHYDIPYLRSEINNDKKINLIWEGQAENLGGFIKFSEIIKNSNLRNKVKIYFITDLFFYKFMKSLIKVNTHKYLTKILKDIEFEIHEWTIENLIKYSKISHAAIIPFLNKNMDIFKSENKLHIFWKLGLPVISSMNYSYEREMNKFKIDLIAKKDFDWIKLISSLSNYQVLSMYKSKIPSSKYFDELEKDKIENWKKILI